MADVLTAWLTRRKGASLPGRKETAASPLERIEAPERLYFPTVQHQGKPAVPVVKRRDRVRVGALLAEADGPYSANVHSSVSGTVVAVEASLHPWGDWVQTIVVENDGDEEPEEGPEGVQHPEDRDPAELRERIRQAGVVGMGGAMYPTHLKIPESREGAQIDTLILNGCECEPILTCDHRVLLEFYDKIVYGVRALRHTLGVSRAVIAIEANKPDAVALYRQLGRATGLFEVAELPARYPFGAERVLVPAVTGRVVPADGYPDSVGVVVVNAATAAAVCDALRDGIPLISRPLTVAGGAVERGLNAVAPIGAPTQHVLEWAGLKEAPAEIILGGPMMGIAVPDGSAPVIKGTSGILARTAAELHHYRESACLRCGRCFDACPAGLAPAHIARLSARGQFDEAAELAATQCMECGLCSYVCPADLPVTQLVRLAKRQIRQGGGQ